MASLPRSRTRFKVANHPSVHADPERENLDPGSNTGSSYLRNMRHMDDVTVYPSRSEHESDYGSRESSSAHSISGGIRVTPGQEDYTEGESYRTRRLQSTHAWTR